VNGRQFDAFDGSTLINGFTRNVHDTAESARADGNPDGITGVAGN
jgi:hypothetical protein